MNKGNSIWLKNYAMIKINIFETENQINKNCETRN